MTSVAGLGGPMRCQCDTRERRQAGLDQNGGATDFLSHGGDRLSYRAPRAQMGP